MSNLRTVPLPTALGSIWDNFAWPCKMPDDDLEYAIDATGWLAAGPLGLVSADLFWTPGLTVTGPTYGGARSIVRLRISGGLPGTVALVRVLLRLTDDAIKEVVVELPIQAASPAGLVAAPDTLLRVGGLIVTVGGMPIAVESPGSLMDSPNIQVANTADSVATTDSTGTTVDAGPASGGSNGPTNTADGITPTADVSHPTADAA